MCHRKGCARKSASLHALAFAQRRVYCQLRIVAHHHHNCVSPGAAFMLVHHASIMRGLRRPSFTACSRFDSSASRVIQTVLMPVSQHDGLIMAVLRLLPSIVGCHSRNATRRIPSSATTSATKYLLRPTLRLALGSIHQAESVSSVQCAARASHTPTRSKEARSEH